MKLKAEDKEMIGGFVILTVIALVFQRVIDAVAGIWKSHTPEKIGLEELPDVTGLPDMPEEGNIAAMYERMCVKEPSAYATHPKLAMVREQYAKLLKGALKDPEGLHVPSEMIDGEPNPDYRKYLLAQRRACSSPWIEQELRRNLKTKTVHDLRHEYMKVLQEMGMPEELLWAAVTDERINTFDADDWKKMAQVYAPYIEEYGKRLVRDFLDLELDKATLLNPEAMEMFAVMREHQIPKVVYMEVIRGRLTVEQAMEVVDVVEDTETSWDKALQYVLEKSLTEAKDKELRELYRKNRKG